MSDGEASAPATGWKEASKVYFDRRVLAVLFLGFSSGLPLLLVFSTLSLWLKDEGISNTLIGVFALVRTPYTFKFLWAPLIDRVPFPCSPPASAGGAPGWWRPSSP